MSPTSPGLDVGKATKKDLPQLVELALRLTDEDGFVRTVGGEVV